jgi:hypothetical protein
MRDLTYIITIKMRHRCACLDTLEWGEGERGRGKGREREREMEGERERYRGEGEGGKKR